MRGVQGLGQQRLSPFGDLTDSKRDGNDLSNEGLYHTPWKELEGQKIHTELKPIELSAQRINVKNEQKL